MEYDYYNLQRIKAKKDIDNKEPSIYIIESNRSDGKTTAILLECMKGFKREGKQFGLIYRRQYELSDAHTIFETVFELMCMQNVEMTSTPCARGLFYELSLCDLDESGDVITKVTCGYAFGLHNVDSLKKYSPRFKKVWNLFLDEFQLEQGRYLPDEVGRLNSLYISIARGSTKGSPMRDVKLYIAGNKVTMLNPYFMFFGIPKRIKQNTRFLRGKRWVCNFNYNRSAALAITESPFGQAMSDCEIMRYSTEDVYLFDSEVFIDKLTGNYKYFLTIHYKNKSYGVRQSANHQIIHVSKKVDPTCRQVYAFLNNDFKDDMYYIDKKSSVWKYLKEAYTRGMLRFDEMQTKDAFFDILCLDIMK